MRTLIWCLALFAMSCGGSTSSPSDGGVLPSGDGGVVASSDKSKCELYLTCLNLAEQGAYAAGLALYGDSSACWQNDTTSANCANACVSAYDQIESECNCTSPTNCTLCASANPAIFGANGANKVYTATAATGSCLKVDGNIFISVSNGVANFGFEVSHADGTSLDSNISLTKVPLMCDGSATIMWSGTDNIYSCPQTASGSLTSANGTLTLMVSVNTPACNGNDGAIPASTCAGTFTLTPSAS